MTTPSQANADACFQTDFTTVYKTLHDDPTLQVPHTTWTAVPPDGSKGVPVTGVSPTTYDPAYCAKDFVVTSMCVGGDHIADCGSGTQFSVGGCGPITADVLVPNAKPERGDVYCHTGAGQADISRGTPDGSYPVGCPVNSVLVGFGTSGQGPTVPYDGTTYRNVALCAPVGDAYIVDRGAPNFQFPVDSNPGHTLTCDEGTVATAFCKTSGGAAHCAGFDSAGNLRTDNVGNVMGWLRCDTIRARPAGVEAPTFPPLKITPDGGDSQPSAAACGTTRHAEVGLTACADPPCGPTSKFNIGSYVGLLNEMYTTNTDAAGTHYLSVRGDDTKYPASIYCGPNPARGTCNVADEDLHLLPATCGPMGQSQPGPPGSPGVWYPPARPGWLGDNGAPGVCLDAKGCVLSGGQTATSTFDSSGPGSYGTCNLYC